MPAIALQHTDAGAMAFAKFYLQTVDWGYATTNASYMRHYYDTECVRCKILDDAITGVAKHKWHFIGGRSKITRITPFATNQFSSDLVFNTVSDIDSGTEVDSNGNIHGGDIAHKEFPEKIGVHWNGASWRAIYMHGGTS